MRYWAYLVGKLAVAAGVMYPLLRLVDKALPEYTGVWTPLSSGQQILVYNLLLMAWFLGAAGLCAVIIRDQRRRCRVCLRKLAMPVETGSWGGALIFGRPRTEYICPYGHGTLQKEELQITGLQSPEWMPHGSYWEELCALEKDTNSHR